MAEDDKKAIEHAEKRLRELMRRHSIAALTVSMVALAFASASVFDIMLFGNYAAVPFHASSSLVASVVAIIVWAVGRRNRY